MDTPDLTTLLSPNAHRATESDSTHPKVRRGLTSHAQNAHRSTARAIRPTQKRAEGSLRMLKMRTAPQRERFDPPKVRRGFTSRSAPQPGAKVLHLPQNLHEKLQSVAPAKKFNQNARKCCACHAKQACHELKIVQTAAPATKSNFGTHPKLARDCGARMILTSLNTFQARQNEPIVQQSQRKGRRRKHYHAPAKQDAANRPPLERKS